MGLRDLIIKKFADRVSEKPSDKKDIIHPARRKITLPKNGRKAVLSGELADDLTLTEEEISDLTGKKPLRYTGRVLTPALPVEDLTLTDEELTDIIGIKSIGDDKIVSLENLPDEDLTLTNEEIGDLIGKKTARAGNLPDEDLTLTNEEILDIIGEKRTKTRISPAPANLPNALTLNNDLAEKKAAENIDQVAVLTDFLDEPTFNGSNLIGLIEKKSEIPETDHKFSISDDEDGDESFFSDKGEIIDLTGKEADIPKDQEEAIIDLTGKEAEIPEDREEAIIDLTEKEPPEDFAENGMFLQAESVSSDVVDYEAMILKDFLDDTFIEDEQAIHLIEDDTSDASREDDEEIIELMELAVEIPDDDNTFLTEKKEEKSSLRRENVIDLREVAANFPDDDEHTINIVKTDNASENTDIAVEVFDDEDLIFPAEHSPSDNAEEIIDIADVAVEVSEDDEDTINLTGKEILAGYDIHSLFPFSEREETESLNGFQETGSLTAQEKNGYKHPETVSEDPAEYTGSAEPKDDVFLSFQDIQDIERMMAGDSDGLFSAPKTDGGTGEKELFASGSGAGEEQPQVCRRAELNELSQEEKDLLEWLETDSDQKKDIPDHAGNGQENAWAEQGNLFSETETETVQDRKDRMPRGMTKDKLFNSQKEPAYIKTLEQFVTKKLSEKIEHIEIDEQMIEKVLSEKIEGIVADMIEKAISKERTRLMKHAGRKTKRG